MLHLDHLTVIAPTLAEGVAHVRDCLGIDAPFGRQHVYMGTHNHLLRLGDSTYLEIVALDPGGTPPGRSRWFGLDDQMAVRTAWTNGQRLRGWVARSDNIDSLLPQHEATLGRKVELSSNGIGFHFAIPEDGSLPLGGAAPSVIDRGGRPPPVASMPDLGAALQCVILEHPEPEMLRALYRTLGVATPFDIRKAGRLSYRALIRTPDGVRELT